MKAPEVSVGIVHALEIVVRFNASYTAKGQTVDGEETICYEDGGIQWRGNIYQELQFTSRDDAASFSLDDVVIGINFHWERRQTQTFCGSLRLVVHEGRLCAINRLPVEKYLESVISSEMSATAPLELLKAHAVISRSWLLAQMLRRKSLHNGKDKSAFFAYHKTDDTLIRWYDREDHTLYDVCADDHCQRYQGITSAAHPNVLAAVNDTAGQVLMHGDVICDARFSKCCGGITEEYHNCWEPAPKPYLVAVRDYVANSGTALPDLISEREARKWILSSPRAFCNTRSSAILSRILNNYDQETVDFYRWQVVYTQEEISELINSRFKHSFGRIIDLEPIERGPSGRIVKLKIVGTERTMTIGKELEIRRVLSKTHLFSSAFVVDKSYDADDITVPTSFTLSGAGWGHGVGLCQIGAAVMAEKGYTYTDILSHYYADAEPVGIY